jgi:hypothetical protein
MPYTNGLLLFKKDEMLIPNVIAIIIIDEKSEATLFFIVL